MATENQLLTHGTEHFHGKGFVADGQVDALAVGQCGGNHRFFVECGNHAALQPLGDTVLGGGNAVQQVVQSLVHAVAAHLVRVANAYPQLGVGAGQGAEPLVDGGHRCAGLLDTDRWQNRRGDLNLRQWVILLLRALLPGVIA
ncbi:hypothetical protein UMZ34_08145 [Halopseudomonas pachastrellae]|nr:hypothetical protein UMZ34_08145 [Halopseudomonas pachastrellae]